MRVWFNARHKFSITIINQKKLELRNDNILVIKHTLYICFIFPLPLIMIKLFYGEYILVNLHCQWERRVIHTKIVYIYFTQVHVYGIAYPFSIPFRFPFRVLVTPFSTSTWQNTAAQEPSTSTSKSTAGQKPSPSPSKSTAAQKFRTDTPVDTTKTGWEGPHQRHTSKWNHWFQPHQIPSRRWK